MEFWNNESFFPKLFTNECIENHNDVDAYHSSVPRIIKRELRKNYTTLRRIKSANYC